MLLSAIIFGAITSLPTTVFGCSRALENKYDTVISGRSMDWMHSFDEGLVIYPRGQEMDGGAIKGNSVEWVSKYASVVSNLVPYLEKYMGEGEICEGYATIEKDGALDGINEAGLGVHLLYLGEEDGTEYAENSDEAVNLSYLRWVRYLLDNFATVEEAIDGMEAIKINKAELCWTSDNMEIGVHLAIQDATGDSAIFEHLGGELQVYHSKTDTLVMTNEPDLPKQKELLKKYSDWGGDIELPDGLPGSVSSPDRFVRLEYYLQYLPEPSTDAEAIANVQTILQSTNVPFGAPYGGGVYPTWWNSFLDQTHKVYYYKTQLTPNTIWVDLEEAADMGVLDEGKPNLRLAPQDEALVGNVLCDFKTIDDNETAPDECMEKEVTSVSMM